LACVHRIHVANSSRKIVPPEANSNFPFFWRRRTGKRTALVTNKIKNPDSINVSGQRRAIHCNIKLCRFSRRARVNFLRQQILSVRSHPGSAPSNRRRHAVRLSKARRITATPDHLFRIALRPSSAA